MALKITDTANAATGINPGPAVTAVVGGVTYLFVGNLTSSTVNIYRVDAGGSLTGIGSAVPGPAGISAMTVSSNAGQAYLHVTGYVDSTMATYAITGTGSLVSVGSPKALGFQPNAVTSVVVGGQTFVYAGTDTIDVIKGFGFASGSLVELPGAPGSATALAAAAVGGTTYLFSAGRDNDTLKVFVINANGALSPTPTTVTDNATLMLDGVASLATAVVDGATFLFAGGTNDDGISVFSVGAGGTLTNVHTITDAQSPSFKLDAVVSLTTQVINGTTYLFAAGQADDGVSVFSVGSGGSLTNVANLADQGARELDGATGVASVVVGGETYLFATGQFEDGVSGFKLHDNSGNDTYHFLVGTEVADESGGGGIDTIYSTFSLSLSDTSRILGDVEYLTLTGSAGLNGTGNALANRIFGNDGNNILDGGGAGDTLAGGLGDDIYVVDNAGDVIDESGPGASGYDTVRSFVSHKLVANLEALVLSGAAKANGSGNALSNSIQGNRQANVLKGGDGADTLDGNAGRDRLDGGRGRDAYVFDTKLRSTTIDTIVKFSHKDDTIWLDRDIFNKLNHVGDTIGAKAFYASKSGKAHDRNDRIIYETDTGKLFYDDNGSARGHAVQIAQLDKGLHLTQADFLIV